MVHSDNTKEAYESDARVYETWCFDRGFESLPTHPKILHEFTKDEFRKGLKPSTAGRRLSAITWNHHKAGKSFDAWDKTRDLVDRFKQVFEPDRKRPLSDVDVDWMVAVLPATAIGARNGAVIRLAFWLALELQDLVSLTLKDIDLKGGHTSVKGMQLDDVTHCALSLWLDHRPTDRGDPLFVSMSRGHGNAGPLTGRSIRRIVKDVAELAGLDHEDIGYTSLRNGFRYMPFGWSLGDWHDHLRRKTQVADLLDSI